MQIEIPRMGGNPISNRITAVLIQELKDGEYANSQLLPSEIELSAKMGVSRSVIRDSLSNLEKEGFIERIRGIGTIIHRDIVNLTSRLDMKYEYNSLIRGMGYSPSSDSIRLKIEPASDTLSEALSIDSGAPILVCEKRLLAGKVPVIYSIDRIPLDLLGDISYKEIDWSQPIFDILEKYSGICVDTDVAKIAPVIGPAYVRERLAVKEDDALLLIDEVGYFKLTQPILQTYGFYTNFFEFTVLRKKF